MLKSNSAIRQEFAALLQKKGTTLILSECEASIDTTLAVAPDSDECRNLEALVEAYAIHRRSAADQETARRFLISRKLPPDTQVLLYGAGTQTARLLGWLEQAKIRPVAVVDRRAADIGTFQGLPTLPVEEAGRIACDIALVAHPIHEADMVDRLISVSFPPSRIMRLFSDPDFTARTVAERSTALLAKISPNIQYIVVGSDKWSIVSDENLACCLPPSQTMKIHWNPWETFAESTVFPTLDSGGSLEAVIRTLRALQPKLVYLRTTLSTNWAAPLIRKALPGGRLVHEMYDVSSILPEPMLKDWIAMNQEAIDAAAAAERLSFRFQDLIISKRAGPAWDALLSGVSDRYRCFMGSMPETEPLAVDEPFTPPLRILYAGIIPRPEDLGKHPGDYNFIEMLEELADDPEVSIDLYNMLDEGGEESPFASYGTRFAQTGVNYHARVTVERIGHASSSSHVGWLYRPQAPDGGIEAASVLGQRFTAYIFAGLPVILDDGWSMMAQLVMNFRAGLVAPRNRPEQIARLLRDTDWASMRCGAQAMAAYFRAENRETLDRIAKLIAE